MSVTPGGFDDEGTRLSQKVKETEQLKLFQIHARLLVNFLKFQLLVNPNEDKETGEAQRSFPKESNCVVLRVWQAEWIFHS